jgi:hypothetical protein
MTLMPGVAVKARKSSLAKQCSHLTPEELQRVGSCGIPGVDEAKDGFASVL